MTDATFENFYKINCIKHLLLVSFTFLNNIRFIKKHCMQKIHFSDGYLPSMTEEYMNPKHIEYFRRKLLLWKEKLLKETQTVINSLKEEKSNCPDVIDKASAELEAASASLIQIRHYNLINKIDRAIKRIRDNTYGYCEDTGEEIGLGRLEARPIATLCLAAQERHEKHK